MLTENSLPKRGRGRLNSAKEAEYQKQLEEFCGQILEINSRLDFRVSSRGWCYILEDSIGLPKGEFDAAQRLINDCRKAGMLPLDICAEDNNRKARGIEELDGADVETRAGHLLEYLNTAHAYYTPISFWGDQTYYVEMQVEKIDLLSLFERVCDGYRVPITNARGWNDINSRAAMMQRFAEQEAEGKQCVLLFCGDFDPGGLNISGSIRSNFADLTGAVGWTPENLIIDRFGLNFDFIQAQNLSWIENLETASGQRLDHTKHPDHNKPYVQSYLREYGARKVEANALVVRPTEGRELCRQAILKYIDDDAIGSYRAQLSERRELLREEIVKRLQEARV